MASRGTTNVLAGGPSRAEQAAAPAVQLRSVTRVFGVTPAVVRVDMTVERGEVVLVRGPNGAGKSTLLRVVAKELSPTYGGGEVLGFDLLRERERIRAQVELLGHRTRLYEDLTAAENLRFACAMTGAPTANVPEALERVGLADVADERVRGFSQGMRQRVAVARALLREPALLLLDEPYAGLDTSARDAVDRAIGEAKAAGRTVILATHDVTRGDLATRTVVMDGGRLVEEPHALAAEPPPRDTPSRTATGEPGAPA
ncbi:MAG TPA: ABC transporter ATP-binding protein [Actinomycetota bacterium]|nr:ABC transporter ATP-binding protein [Actinomycetota bacterium]